MSNGNGDVYSAEDWDFPVEKFSKFDAAIMCVGLLILMVIIGAVCLIVMPSSMIQRRCRE